MLKKFKGENGFTGTDITVAIIIILLLMSLISVLFFNITKASKNVERKSEATYVATRVLEEIKSQNYDNIQLTKDGNDESIWQDIKDYKYTNGKKVFQLEDNTYSLEIENGYTCELFVQNHIPSGVTANPSDLVKVVKVKIKYKVGGEIKEVQLETTIVRNK